MLAFKIEKLFDIIAAANASCSETVRMCLLTGNSWGHETMEYFWTTVVKNSSRNAAKAFP